MRGSRIALLACVLGLFAWGTQAKISNERVKRDSRSIILIEEPFGFLDNGYIELAVSKLEVGVAKAMSGQTITLNEKRMGFFITTTQFEIQLEAQYTQGTCMLDVKGPDVKARFFKVVTRAPLSSLPPWAPAPSFPRKDYLTLAIRPVVGCSFNPATLIGRGRANVGLSGLFRRAFSAGPPPLTLHQVLFTLNEVNRTNGVQSGTFNYKTKVPKAGQYSIFFASCEPNAIVSFNIRTELYNIKAGGFKDYLPVSWGSARGSGVTRVPFLHPKGSPLPCLPQVGEDALVGLYSLMTVLFFLAGAWWAYYVYKNQQYAHKIHHLMTLLAIFKVLTLMTQVRCPSPVRCSLCKACTPISRPGSARPPASAPLSGWHVRLHP